MKNDIVEKLIITNFQSHKKTKLYFTNGVNVLIGSSDVGKSAIIRAFEWIFFNKPDGDEFRSTWGGNTSIITRIGKHKIKRLRSKDRNCYELTADGEEIQNFDALGRGNVPEQISSIINMNEINVQDQHDPAFLLSPSPWTAGEVSKFLNKVVNLEIIDTTIKRSVKFVKDVTLKIKQLKETKDIILTDIEDMNWVDSAKSDIDELIEVENKLWKKRKNKKDIADKITQIESIQFDMFEVTTLLKAESKLNTLIEISNKLQTKQKENDDLKNLLNSISIANKKLKNTKSFLLLQDDFLKLSEIQDKIKSVSVTYVKLGLLLKSISNTEELIDKLKERIKTLSEKFDSEMPNICPLCDTNLDE